MQHSPIPTNVLHEPRFDFVTIRFGIRACAAFVRFGNQVILKLETVEEAVEDFLLRLDLVSIAAAAIGGGGGAMIGGLLGSIFSSSSVRTFLLIVGTSVGIGIAQPIIKPAIDPHIGPAMRGYQFDALLAAQMQNLLESQPGIARVFKDHPDVATTFRSRMRTLFEAEGVDGLDAGALQVGSEVMGSAFTQYTVLAKDKDLSTFANVMGRVLQAFHDKDPEACILYQFGPALGKPLATSRMRDAMGQTLLDELTGMMNALIVNSHPAPQTLDKEKAEKLFQELAVKHAPLLVGKSGEVASGARLPASDDEAKAACSFGAQMFQDLGSRNVAEGAMLLRFIFAQK